MTLRAFPARPIGLGVIIGAVSSGSYRLAQIGKSFYSLISMTEMLFKKKILFMDYKIKMRLIGYYNKPDQDMQPENEVIEEAERLRALLEVSFSSLLHNEMTDGVFKSVLRGNSVFILKGENNHLFAYYPYKKFARITDVVYNKRDVTPVPFRYKSWFIPGDDINVRDARKEQDHCFTVTTCGGDFLITKGNRTLPLRWDKDSYISIKSLTILVNDPWITLAEYDPEDDCGGCDGYDYSNCDDSRCKEDCEHCGGRRYICNNGCFNHRYDIALKVRINDEPILREMRRLNNKIKEMYKPFSVILPILSRKSV